MHISRLANWLVDVQIGKQANNQASKQHSQPVLNSTLHILHIVARVQHTHLLHAIYVCCLHTHIHTDTSIRLYCLGEQQTQYCCCYCSADVAATVFYYFSFSFFSCVILWHIMACDFGMAELCLYVHDNRFSTMSRSQWFCFCFLFFDVRPNILQENQITLHMQSQNVCCFPGRWVDVSIYWNIICCFFALRLPSNWVVQMEYTMNWDTSTVHTVYSISPYLCVLLRACLGILFSIPRLLSVFVQ